MRCVLCWTSGASGPGLRLRRTLVHQIVNSQDHFRPKTKQLVAARAGFRCSICKAQTSGPDITQGTLNIGVAAHITAARNEGPRFDPFLTEEQRRGLANAIWLCQNHAHAVDHDEAEYTVEKLRRLKAQHESETAGALGVPTVDADTDGLVKLILHHSQLATDDASVVTSIGGMTTGSEAIRLEQGLYVERKLEGKVLQALAANGDVCILVTGEAGVGKTSLLWRLRSLLDSGSLGFQPVFLKSTFLLISGEPFRTSDGRITPVQLLRATSVLSAASRLIILIDTADLLMHGEAARAELVLLLSGLKSQGCAVIFASRPREAKQLSRFADHSLLLEDYDDSELAQAIDAHCRCFYRNALDDESNKRVRELQSIAAQGLPMRQICVNPLTLRMLFTLYAPDSVPEEIHAFQLYMEFWRLRVTQDHRSGSVDAGSDENLEAGACVVALTMAAEGLPEIPEKMAEIALNASEVPVSMLQQLYGRGILRRGANQTTSFFHQTFFEHAAARGFVRRFGTQGLDHLETRIEQHPDDLFIAPVYEQALLLMDYLPGSAIRVDEKLVVAFTHVSIIRRIAGFYVFSHRERVSEAVETLVDGRLSIEEHAIIEHFLTNAVNWSSGRIPRLFMHLNIVWARENWRERQHIMSLLERLAFRDAEGVRQFLIENSVREYLNACPVDYPGERLFVRVLLVTSRHLPEWSRDQLIGLLRTSGRTVSLDLSVHAVRSLTSIRGGLNSHLAEELSSLFSSIQRGEVRGYHELTEALGVLWASEWIDKKTPICQILAELDREPLRSARFLGVSQWLRSRPDTPLNDIVMLVQRAPLEDSWLWLSLVFRSLLDEPNWQGRDFLITTLRDWIGLLWTEQRLPLLTQVLRALLSPTLDGEIVRAVFNSNELLDEGPWLDPNTLGPFLAAGYLVGQPGAVAAVKNGLTDPRSIPAATIDSFLSGLTNFLSSNERVAEVYLTIALAGRPPKGFAAAISTITEAWPRVLRTFADILFSKSKELMEARSSNDRRIATTIWNKLVEQRLIPIPVPGIIIDQLNVEKSDSVRAGLTSVLAISAQMGTEDALPVLEYLKRLATDRNPEVRTRAILALSRITARTPADACRHGRWSLSVVLESELQSDRIGELGLILSAMAQGCSEQCDDFIRLIISSKAVASLSGQAKRSLVHRFRKPFRQSLELLPLDKRRSLLSLVPQLDSQIARLVADVLMSLDFDRLVTDFDNLLNDSRVDSDIKELIRRHKYVRQRTVGGNQWPELFDLIAR